MLLKPKLMQKLGPADAAGDKDEDEEHLLVNWSGTHECRPRVLAQPESLEELEALVADAHAAGTAAAVCSVRAACQSHQVGCLNLVAHWHAAGAVQLFLALCRGLTGCRQPVSMPLCPECMHSRVVCRHSGIQPATACTSWKRQGLGNS